MYIAAVIGKMKWFMNPVNHAEVPLIAKRTPDRVVIHEWVYAHSKASQISNQSRLTAGQTLSESGFFFWSLMFDTYNKWFICCSPIQATNTDH